MFKFNKQILVFLSIALLLTACGGTSTKSGSATKSDESVGNKDAQAKEIKIGMRLDYVPVSYMDEKGNPAGYDIEVAKLIDERLPQYKFTYEAVSQEVLLTGLNTGKYAAAFAGFFSNPERRKNYLFPEENIGASVVGLNVRAKDADVKNLSDLAKKGYKLAPLAGTGGTYGIVRDFNEKNPDQKVKIELVEWITTGDAIKWVDEGRYDASIEVKSEAKDFYSHEPKYAEKMVFNSFAAIETWTLFNKEQTEFAKAYDKAMKQLKDEGKLKEISTKYFGEDVHQYVHK